jgi:hypothetical protein
VRYARACHRLVSECFARAVDGGRRHMQRAQGQLARFARKSGVGRDRLDALRSLYVRPAARSFDFTTRSLYLDRIASFFLACALSTAALFIAAYMSTAGGSIFAVPAVLLVGFSCIGRGSNRGPQASMQLGAERIAALFRARWVCMGHTHQPVVTQVGADAHYVNLGCWGQDDPPDERTAGHQSPCTFFVIQQRDGEYVGEFMRWDAERGPVPAQSAPAKAAH